MSMKSGEIKAYLTKILEGTDPMMLCGILKECVEDIQDEQKRIIITVALAMTSHELTNEAHSALKKEKDGDEWKNE